MVKAGTLTLLGLAAAGAISTHAIADAQTEEVRRSVDVPAGDLGSALVQLAQQSGVEFVYDMAQIKGLRTQGVHGEYTPRAAVTKLLEGTNLTLTTHSSGALLIAAPQVITHIKPRATEISLAGSAENVAQAGRPTPEPGEGAHTADEELPKA